MIEPRKITDKLLFPPIWIMLLLAVCCTVALIGVFVRGIERHPVSYVVYVISFYTFSVVSIACVRVFPGYYRNLKQKIYSNKFGNRYFTDPAYKIQMNLYISLAVNLLYAALNLFSGIYFRTAWFMLFAGYYTIMAIMRFLLLRYAGKKGIGKDRLGELKRSRLCAFILLTVNLALSGTVLMMIKFGRGFEYYGVLIYVMAMYTFYITVLAIVNMVKYRKYNSPVLSVAKAISFTAALISMLSLETAMLSKFGKDSSPFMRETMIIATGAGISIVVCCIASYIICKNRKEINKIKYEKNSGKGVK